MTRRARLLETLRALRAEEHAAVDLTRDLLAHGLTPRARALRSVAKHVGRRHDLDTLIALVGREPGRVT